MKKKWNLDIDGVIWVEFWDEIPESTVSLKFVIDTKNELLNTEIRLLPSQPKPTSTGNYSRQAGHDVIKKPTSQLKTINTRMINLVSLRQRSLNIIFDYQELNPHSFNKKTNNKFNYPITYKLALQSLSKIKHKKNTNDHLALISLLYVGQIHRGDKSPYVSLSKSTGYSEYYLKNLIKKARYEGFLTKPINRGISGGALTKKCIRTLKSYSSSI